MTRPDGGLAGLVEELEELQKSLESIPDGIATDLYGVWRDQGKLLRGDLKRAAAALESEPPGMTRDLLEIQLSSIRQGLKAHRRETVHRRPVRRYAVTINDYAFTSTTVYSARTPAAARYSAFVALSDGSGTFREFLTLVVSVRLATTSPTRYDYAREHYGVDVTAGQRVMAGGNPGVVGDTGNPRASMIEVILDGRNAAGIFHPSEIVTDLTPTA